MNSKKKKKQLIESTEKKIGRHKELIIQYAITSKRVIKRMKMINQEFRAHLRVLKGVG